MIVEEWARHIENVRFENFDRELVEWAKNRVIDIVGCMIGGANAPGCSMLIDLVKEWGGRKEATILVHGVKAPAHNVAMVNCIMARSFDFGVMMPFIDGKPVPSHISETTVPTAITVAEWKHAGGKELITALVLGDDINTRILKAADFSPLNNFDGIGTVNLFGAAAITSKLLGLNTKQILNAFGIALDQAAGTMQNTDDGVHSFKLPQGLAARAGVFSAELASKGFTGVIDPLLSRHGYFALFGQTKDPEILTKELGKKFYADAIHKPYPCCRATHPSIDCALDLVQKHDIKTEDIGEITLNVTPGQRDGNLGQPWRIGDFPQGNAIFNLRYNVANVLLRKSVKIEHYTEVFIRDPGVNDLIKKVNIIATLPTEKFLDVAELKVRMKDGQEFSSHVDVAKGNPIQKPLTKEEIEEKFRKNVAFSKTVSNSKAEAVLKMLNQLEEIDDITRVIRLLVK